MDNFDQGRGNQDISEALAERYGLEEPHEWPKERPLGVTVLAVLNWLSAILLAIVTLIVWSNIRDDTGGTYSYFQLGNRRIFTVDNVGIFLALSLVESALSLVVGIGLWKIKAWARILAVVMYVLSLVVLLWNNFADPVTGAVLAVALFALGSIIYLMQPTVRASFED